MILFHQQFTLVTNLFSFLLTSFGISFDELVNWLDVIIIKLWLNQLFSPNQCVMLSTEFNCKTVMSICGLLCALEIELHKLMLSKFMSLSFCNYSISCKECLERWSAFLLLLRLRKWILNLKFAKSANRPSPVTFKGLLSVYTSKVELYNK